MYSEYFIVVDKDLTSYSWQFWHDTLNVVHRSRGTRSPRKNKTPTVFTRSEFLSRGSPPRELLRSANPNS